jgi:hypothetical protein
MSELGCSRQLASGTAWGRLLQNAVPLAESHIEIEGTSVLTCALMPYLRLGGRLYAQKKQEAQF